MPDEIWAKLMMPGPERETVRGFFRFVFECVSMMRPERNVIDLSNFNWLNLYSTEVLILIGHAGSRIEDC